MRKQFQKSWEKAFANIFLLFPKRCLLLGLLFMALWQGCKKEEAPTPTPEPTPTPKTDTPTEFVMKTDGLPEGVSVDITNKIITVPLKMPNETIISFFKKGVASDADGDAGVETIEAQGNKIVIVIWGTNGKTNEKETQTIKYTINRQAKAIPTNDIAWYEEPRSESIVAYYKEQKETIDGMHIPAIRALLQDNVLKPTDQKTTVLEVGEGGSHTFWKNMQKLINNIRGIDYVLLDLEKYNKDYTPEMKKEFETIVKQNTQNNNFLLFEDNSGGRWRGNAYNNIYIGDILEDNNQTYAATAEDKEYELIANEGHSKVSLPVYKESNGKWYFFQNSSWWDPEDNPFTNSIESPLIGGVDFGSSSGASAANAATWALGIQLLQRMGIQVDKQLWNTIFTDTEYDECFEPAYWIDPNTKEEYIKGKVLIWNKFIGKFNVFWLNNEAIKNLQSGQKVPLLKHWDKIDNTKLILQEEKGIVRENDIVYLDYDLLAQQGINPEEFIKNPEYKYIIGDKKTKKLYWKPEK